MRSRSAALAACAAGVLLLATAACTPVDPYYVVGNVEQRKQLRQLLTRLDRDREAMDDETRYIVVQQISYNLARANRPERQITFLTTYVKRHPADPYIAAYLQTVAEAYDELGATPFAMRYYRQILRSTNDLEIQGESIHFRALWRLKELTDKPEDLILYCQELIARFADLIDLGETYHLLGRMYEAVGEWELAIQAYDKFLQTGVREVSGYPQARQQIREKVEFFHSRKDWTFPDLATLVQNVRNAIQAKDMAALARYRAKASFFTKSWRALDSDVELASEFEITRFLSGRVTMAPELDTSSTNREAYLRIFNTADYRIPVWYLYFRRVDYPPDPEINGNWEWAGIYLGDRTT